MTKELVITSPIEERYVDYNGHKTYVKIVGERKDNGKKPLLVLHGGPGDCHDYLLEPCHRACRASATARSSSTTRRVAASPCSRAWGRTSTPTTCG